MGFVRIANRYIVSFVGKRRAGLTTCMFAATFWTFAGKTFALVSLYYLFSIGLTFYQKWFIKDFPFPLSVVMCHLIVKFFLSAIARVYLRWLYSQERVTLRWGDYLKKLTIAGMASAMDIGLSNWSFRFITVSLYTMSKSTCIIFILIFSVALGLETLRASLVIVVVMISSGLFMFTYSSTEFNWDGFIMVMLASIMAGLRWTVAQLVMQRNETGLSHPIDMMYHIQPWMIVGLLPLVIPFEGLPLATSKSVFRFHDDRILLMTVWQVLIGAVLAFFMEVSEYLLLVNTSSLTLSISGIIKEVVTLILAVQVNGDTLSTLNKFGLLFSIIGIVLHVFKRSIRADEDDQFHVAEGMSMALLSTESAESDSNDSDQETVLYAATVDYEFADGIHLR